MAATGFEHGLETILCKSRCKLSIGSGRVVAKRRLPAKFAGLERGHRRLNFGWQALGKALRKIGNEFVTRYLCQIGERRSLSL